MKQENVTAEKAAQVQEFVKELDRLSHGRGNSAIFAQRARYIINAAYSTWGIVFAIGSDEEMAKADKLMDMGITEAIYGRGRAMLRK